MFPRISHALPRHATAVILPTPRLTLVHTPKDKHGTAMHHRTVAVS